jgi:hypothetical protein
MRKKMLRSMLACAFSAGIALGAVSALDLHWGGAPGVESTTGNQAAVPPDLHWGGSAPATQADLHWGDSAPATQADLHWGNSTPAVQVDLHWGNATPTDLHWGNGTPAGGEASAQA